jgi:hypothetical protein
MDKKPVWTMGQKIVTIIGGVFSGVGIALVAVGLLLGLHPWSPDSARVTTQATIVGFDTSSSTSGHTYSSPVVEYWVDGERHTARLNGSASADSIGDAIEVSYDPNTPTDVRSSRSDIMVMAAVGGIGGLFVLIGGGLLIGGLARRRRNARLFNEGTRLTGEIVGVEQNWRVTINNVHPWRIRCTAYLPGSETPVVCLSANWMSDPTPIIQAQDVRTLPIYIDRDDKRGSKPYVDDSTLRTIARSGMLHRGSFTPITYPTAPETAYPTLPLTETLAPQPAQAPPVTER